MQRVSHQLAGARYETDLSGHFLRNVARKSPNDREEVHLDERHRTRQALLEPDDVDLRVLKVALRTPHQSLVPYSF